MRLLLWVLAFLLSAPIGAQSRDVPISTSPDGRFLALYRRDAGLTLVADRSSRSLKGFSRPRFDGLGGLWLTRSVDDGYHELGRMFWRLDLRSGTLTPAPRYRVDAVQRSRSCAGAVRFCLDAGHGGSDPGAVGNELREADVNLDVCLRLQRLLRRDTADTRGGGAWELLLTRAEDVTVSLQERTDMANAFGAETFLSVHMNAFTSPAANGTETYCYLGKSGSRGGAFRNEVQAGALTAWGLTNRGVKEANFHVLRETVMPAALLEGGFVTSPIDSAVMADPAQRQRLAEELLFAIQRHHGFAAYLPRSGPWEGRPSAGPTVL